MRRLRLRKSKKTYAVAAAGLALVAIAATATATSAQATPRAAPLAGFMIKAVMNNRCLSIASNNSAPGAEVSMWDCNGQPGQFWTWNGSNLVSDLGTGVCLDVRGTDPDNGAAVGTFTCANTRQMNWNYNSDFDQLTNFINGKCLTIADNNMWNGASVQTSDCVPGISGQNLVRVP